ncbi:uncharacterized protein LOC129302780 [Prosopis cineraria]|uniref:uncharacterized protein LOC129302780 n=1 Tax=Prosopis cineraria TaxID=364024 RepID=UPI00240F21A5|nr:uncharacterized protein LOC129302780 [Prosopis cineraria]
MDQRLVEASRNGDVIALFRMLEEDPQILDKASLAYHRESPLHVAALGGKANFVKQILSLMPSLATQPNQKGLIPLHMASAKGHDETVRELLKVKLDDDSVKQCLLKDDDGWTPLHYAAWKGKVEAFQELVSHIPECMLETTPKGETVLHLAVKANQFGALRNRVAQRERERETSDHTSVLSPSFSGFSRRQRGCKWPFVCSREFCRVHGFFSAPVLLSSLLLPPPSASQASSFFRCCVVLCGRRGGSFDFFPLFFLFVQLAKGLSLFCVVPVLLPEVPNKNVKINDINEENYITVDVERITDTEVPKESGAKAEDNEMQFQNIKLLVATIILTLTYQGLGDPPSTLFKEGSEINWECLFDFSSRKNHRSSLINFIKNCPALLAFMFLIMNTLIFFTFILIVVTTLRGRQALQLRLLTLYFTICYSILLMCFF